MDSFSIKKKTADNQKQFPIIWYDPGCPVISFAVDVNDACHAIQLLAEVL